MSLKSRPGPDLKTNKSRDIAGCTLAALTCNRVDTITEQDQILFRGFKGFWTLN